MGTLPVSTAFYRNKNELGFWRQMSCSAQIGRGVGGCVVTNWQNETDPSLGVPNRGSVAMDISSAGVTRFYVFGPDDVLTPKARLDSEGDKFVPRICTVCHGGSYPQPGTSSDLGAMFHEFEPSSFQLRSGIDQAGAEQEWFALNQRVRGANTQIRREAEGAPAGTDHGAAALVAYIDSIYPPDFQTTGVSRTVQDPAHVPASWQAQPGESAALVAAKASLWTGTVNQYCMTCHRSRSTLDWSDYAKFRPLSVKVHGTASLQLYTSPSAAKHKGGLPYMPQSELTFTSLVADSSAQKAMQQWLSLPSQ